MSEPLTAEMAEKTARDYVCAVCWGHLITRTVDGATICECGKYGATHSGYTRKSFAERARSESLGELAEAKYNLGPVLGIEPNRNESEILKDLGF